MTGSDPSTMSFAQTCSPGGDDEGGATCAADFNGDRSVGAARDVREQP